MKLHLGGQDKGATSDSKNILLWDFKEQLIGYLCNPSINKVCPICFSLIYFVLIIC